MFFRREKPKSPTFDELLDQARAAGFAVERQPDNRAKVSRGPYVAVVSGQEGGSPRILRAGIKLGNEVGYLLSSGYQMLWGTDSGVKEAATAAQLRGLHAFQEDLMEVLGLTSYYNTSLGTVSTKHVYDRVQGRDEGASGHPWEEAKKEVAAR